MKNQLAKAIVRACSESAFRERLINNPRKALAEEGIQVPEDVNVVIHESSEDILRVVLPCMTAGLPDTAKEPFFGAVKDVPDGLSLEWRENLLVAEGRIDSATAPALKRELIRAFWDVDLDLSHVTFLSSAGLSALLAGQKHLQENDCKMRLLDVPEVINNVLEIAGFSELFETVDRSALESMSYLAGSEAPFLSAGPGTPFLVTGWGPPCS